MRMNKARTKVLVDRKYNFYNVLGIWFLLVTITQDLFKFGDDAVTVTGWGIVGVGILIVSFWSWKPLRTIILILETWVNVQKCHYSLVGCL